MRPRCLATARLQDRMHARRNACGLRLLMVPPLRSVSPGPLRCRPRPRVRRPRLCVCVCALCVCVVCVRCVCACVHVCMCGGAQTHARTHAHSLTLTPTHTTHQRPGEQDRDPPRQLLPPAPSLHHPHPSVASETGWKRAAKTLQTAAPVCSAQAPRPGSARRQPSRWSSHASAPQSVTLSCPVTPLQPPVPWARMCWQLPQSLATPRARPPPARPQSPS